MSVEVLVVDEDEEVLSLTETFLSRQDGLSVSTEMDPERATQRVVDSEFDAVVSDFSMPKVDGLELCRRLRDAGTDVPFFLFTGREKADIEPSAEKEHVTGFVRKGTGSDQYETLAELIHKAVDR